MAHDLHPHPACDLLGNRMHGVDNRCRWSRLETSAIHFAIGPQATGLQAPRPTPTMRLHYILLLAAAAFLAKMDPSSATSSSQRVTLDSPARLISAEEYKTDTKSVLRSETVDDDDEERGVTLPSGTISKFSSMVKSGITSGITSRLQNLNVRRYQNYVDNVFLTYKLDTFKDTIFGSRHMRAWYETVLKVNKANPEVSMLNTMMKYSKKQEDTLARLIHSAKGSVSMGDIATKMQTALFTRWKKAGTDVRKMFTSSGATSALNRQRNTEIIDAFEAFLKQTKYA